MNKKDTGSGFTLGVTLGALIGTGAMLFSRTEEGQHLKKVLTTKLQQTTQALRSTYPHEVEEVEHILRSALLEAQKATAEIKDLSHQATTSVKQKATLMSQSVKAARKEKLKRTFSRSGKPLNTPSHSS